MATKQVAKKKTNGKLAALMNEEMFAQDAGIGVSRRSWQRRPCNPVL